ncbi:29841_t:CDS:2 [Racocetra persica]|uniref:29841_t:CDS:1 n=1 Tax=Racocetra persica TaxID=160502 RepID=A0ACA9KJJ7_9GLOM|nr:29841_t:CDS:2 [Racocetra persica]
MTNNKGKKRSYIEMYITDNNNLSSSSDSPDSVTESDKDSTVFNMCKDINGYDSDKSPKNLLNYDVIIDDVEFIVNLDIEWQKQCDHIKKIWVPKISDAIIDQFPYTSKDILDLLQSHKKHKVGYKKIKNDSKTDKYNKYQKFANRQKVAANYLIFAFDAAIKNFDPDDIYFLISNKDIHSERYHYENKGFEFTEDREVIDSYGNIQIDKSGNTIVYPDSGEAPIFSSKKPNIGAVLLCALPWYRSSKAQNWLEIEILQLDSDTSDKSDSNRDDIDYLSKQPNIKTSYHIKTKKKLQKTKTISISSGTQKDLTEPR